MLTPFFALAMVPRNRQPSFRPAGPQAPPLTPLPHRRPNADMLTPFFALAMIARNRQRSFRSAVVAHVALVSVLAGALLHSPATLPTVGQALLIAGIVEGAVLL